MLYKLQIHTCKKRLGGGSLQNDDIGERQRWRNNSCTMLRKQARYGVRIGVPSWLANTGRANTWPGAGLGLRGALLARRSVAHRLAYLAFLIEASQYAVACPAFHFRRYKFKSTQRASMDAGVKTPQCPHLSSHFCISSTTINLIRVLICRRFRSGRP